MEVTRKLPILAASCLLAMGASAQSAKTPEVAPGKPGVEPFGIVTRTGTVVAPKSDVAPAGYAHTNYKIFVPATHPGPFTTPDSNGEWPGSIGCVYGVSTAYTGCAPGANFDKPKGGWGAIALVDAYHDHTAASDLAAFDTFFGLAAAKFTQVEANSSFGTLGGLTASCSGKPASAAGTGWDLEESLDIEWAHVMAPSAQIILVEACSNSFNDLIYAEYVAGQEVAKYGGGDVSNSWGGGEFSGQVNYDPAFRATWQNVTYFASAGDSAGAIQYPATSPWVVSAGGTTINRDANGNFLSESCWTDSGGGYSTIEEWQSSPDIFNGMGPWSNYQYELFGAEPYVQPFRSVPDFAFDADPSSGVWVYDTDDGGGWTIVGGTSVSSPSLAGLVNSAKNKLGLAPVTGGYYNVEENNLIYSQLFSYEAYKTNFYDVTTGSNGNSVGQYYDQCTGVGTPRGLLGK